MDTLFGLSPYSSSDSLANQKEKEKVQASKGDLPTSDFTARFHLITQVLCTYGTYHNIPSYHFPRKVFKSCIIYVGIGLNENQ